MHRLAVASLCALLLASPLGAPPLRAIIAQTFEVAIVEATELYNDDGEVAMMAQPGERYRVVAVEEDWALVVAGDDPSAPLLWVALDARASLEPVPEVAEPAPAATQPPGPAATPIPGPGTVLLSDDFSDPARASLPVLAQDESGVAGYVGGEYEIRDGRADGFAVMRFVAGTFGDAAISVDARAFGGPDTGRRVVLDCRRQGGKYYRFWVYVQRQFAQLLKDEPQPVGRRLLTERASSAIRQGDQVNRLELSCAGDRIAASVNGTLLFDVRDASPLLPGRLALGVGGSGATARFDNLVVTQQ